MRPTRLLALLTAVLVLLLPLTACGDDGDDGDATTTTTDGTTTTEGTTTTTSAPSGAVPDEVAAVLGDGRLVILDSDSGEIRRTLLEGIEVDDPTKNGIAMSPGGDRVFVVRPESPQAGGHELVAVPAEGGQPEVVAQGRAPAVSPDGTTLAYVEVEVPEEQRARPEPGIVLRDLDTGDERRLVREQERQFHFIVETEWTADGEELAFIAGEIQTSLYVVDAGAESLDGARRLGPEDRDEAAAWRATAPFDGERLAVVETCCEIPERERWAVIAVHVDTGRVEGGVLPQQRVEASVMDADETTDHLLLVTDRRPGGGTLLRWSSPQADEPGEGAGELQHVRDGVVVAAW